MQDVSVEVADVTDRMLLDVLTKLKAQGRHAFVPSFVPRRASAVPTR